MLENLSVLAIVPKAKAIGAERLTGEEYLALMRKRSVIEIVAALQTHPYFQKSLGGLSQTSIHREQLEQALSRDIFFKYESLMRYSFRKNHFGSFFIVKCEINEILAKLQLVSMGLTSKYIVKLPGFLTSKTSFNLIALAQAETAEQCEKVLAATPYAKILHTVLPKSGEKLDYLDCEHAFMTYYYTFVLKKVDEDLSGNAAKETKRLFLREAEIYNLDIIYRSKAFFSTEFTPDKIKRLLLPVYGKLSHKQLMAMADARDLSAFLQMYNGGRAKKYYGEFSARPEMSTDIAGRRALYKEADKLLHFSSSPRTVLAALLFIAELERSNIVTVIEGVRYALPPEKIEEYLCNRM